MYIKMRLAPQDYAHYEDTARYVMFKVDDDFLEWTQEERDHVTDCMIQDAIANYVEVDVDILEGNFEDDPEY